MPVPIALPVFRRICRFLVGASNSAWTPPHIPRVPFSSSRSTTLSRSGCMIWKNHQRAFSPPLHTTLEFGLGRASLALRHGPGPRNQQSDRQKPYGSPRGCKKELKRKRTETPVSDRRCPDVAQLRCQVLYGAKQHGENHSQIALSLSGVNPRQGQSLAHFNKAHPPSRQRENDYTHCS